MSKEIISKPEIIKKIAAEIKNLKAHDYVENNLDFLTSSKGLTADGVNLIISELNSIQKCAKETLQALPDKLDNVAQTFNDSDQAAAGQFKI